MNNFKEYAKYYNLLYKEKDYSREVNYINDLMAQYSGRNIKTILDLGCGTGLHARNLKAKGYNITGVDLSENMIALANQNSQNEDIKFELGDVREVRLNKSFDVAISLFHVASYQQTYNDLEKYLETAYVHLKDNGLFIFDFWYGPAVLSDKPSVRIKRIENKELKITRLSEPVLHPNTSIVDVNFEIQIKLKAKGTTKVLNEKHQMRYWFIHELVYFAKKNGFNVLNSHDWLTNKELSFDSWNGIIILQKNENRNLAI